MSAQVQPKASERVVVLLRPKEKQRLVRLARSERVSSAEILRRSLQAYGGDEDSQTKSLLAEMNTTLDQMIETVRKDRKDVQRTLDAIKRQRTVEL